MAITITERITLYSNQSGLVASLRAQPLTAAGAATGALITTGFVSLGGANYRFTGSVPDDTDTVRYELSSAAGVPVAIGDLVAFLLVPSYIDTEVAAIKAKTDNLPSDPADASDIAASFSTVNTTLGTIAESRLTMPRATVDLPVSPSGEAT
jgi:hypothetical protein